MCLLTEPVFRYLASHNSPEADRAPCCPVIVSDPSGGVPHPGIVGRRSFFSDNDSVTNGRGDHLVDSITFCIELLGLEDALSVAGLHGIDAHVSGLFKEVGAYTFLEPLSQLEGIAS